MTKYTPITFSKLSEAIAYLEDGGYLCQLDGGFPYEVSEEALLSCWRDPLFTKAKPAPWYEKLDGTVENGVLCFEIKAGGHYLACEYDDSDECALCSDGYWRDVSALKPLTRAEIQRFMDNAPEEV